MAPVLCSERSVSVNDLKIRLRKLITAGLISNEEARKIEYMAFQSLAALIGIRVQVPAVLNEITVKQIVQIVLRDRNLAGISTKEPFVEQQVG